MIHTVTADDGFYFGLGLFETIHVKKKQMLLERYHKERLLSSMEELKICTGEQAEPAWNRIRSDAVKTMESYAEEHPDEEDFVLKICVTPANILTDARPYTYKIADFIKGFDLRISPIIRNESSSLVHMKTMNYGDNILEKRRAHSEGFDEPLFLNSKGYVAEGATTNLFAVLDGKLITPSLKSGILPGTMRRFVMEHFDVQECSITTEMLYRSMELFVTNALLGIMPVTNFQGKVYAVGKVTKEITNFYEKMQVSSTENRT
ncbi:MAG: aminotransferase class IV [Lachnospiraceae bacterium]|nr:aminotransferase class IV [Lachnospiraceae bacterium]